MISDRFPRAVVLQLSNVASALSQGAIAFLVLTGRAELWMIIVLSAVHGAVSAMSMPAMAGLVPQLVPRESLQQANALLSLTRNGLTRASARRWAPSSWSPPARAGPWPSTPRPGLGGRAPAAAGEDPAA